MYNQQRVLCRHCGHYQIERVNAAGHIYVLMPGGQFSRCGGNHHYTKNAQSKYQQGIDILRANAEQRKGKKYAPNVPEESEFSLGRRRDDHHEDD